MAATRGFPGGNSAAGGGGANGDGGGAYGHGSASKGSSQYRGVSWDESSQRWAVQLWGGGKLHFIGSFMSEVEAARAYDRAVLRLRGQDARSRSRMNFHILEYNLDEINGTPGGGPADDDGNGDGGGGGGGGPDRSGRGKRRPPAKADGEPQSGEEEPEAGGEGRPMPDVSSRGRVRRPSAKAFYQ